MNDVSKEDLIKYANQINEELEYEKQRRMLNERSNVEQLGKPTNKDASTISFLLDTSKDLEKTEHLLRGDILVKGVWKPQPNPHNKILTELGVQEIINHVLLPHLSLSIILGNITEEQLTTKMRIFYRYLTKFIINRSEDFFEYRKTEQIYERYKELQKQNPEYREYSDEELYEDAKRVSMGELQSKMNHLPMIVQQITNVVHARYSASVNGMAFKELMRNTHVSEITSTSGIMGVGNKSNSFSLFKPSTWR